MASSSHIAASLAAIARSIGTPNRLDEALDAIVRSARVSPPGINHVGISTVDRRGRIETKATTDELVRQLDDAQYTLGEGPCYEALRTQRVVSSSLKQEKRWPRYVSEALQAGLRSQLAVQLFVDDEGVLGGLNLYSTESDEIDPQAEEIAELFAAHAAIALSRAREVTGLEAALASRKVIGQALGILMERHGIDEDRAFSFLTRVSSHGNVKLRDVAQQLVDELNAPPEPPPE